MNQFCPVTPGCDDQSAPTANYSSETPDAVVYIARNYGDQQNPPLGKVWYASSCVGRVQSTVSQADANAAAQRANLNCLSDLWPDEMPNPNNDPGQPPVIYVPSDTFTNTEQSCDYECADGSIYTYIVPAGTFSAFNQATADSFAHSYACNQSIDSRICLGELDVDGSCLGEYFEGFCLIQSGNPLSTIIVSDGSLPPGLSFIPEEDGFTISGEASGTGAYAFTVQASDVFDNFNEKQFIIRVASIANSTLTNAGYGQSYSETLATDGAISGSAQWTVVDGALPDGLTLDSSTGEISGTPTADGTFTFTVQMEDGH